jgi:hypothetical protein
MTSSPLRNFSTTDIERAIAKALADLTGSKFIVDISNTTFSSGEMYELTGTSERVGISFSAAHKQGKVDVDLPWEE